MPLLPSKSYRQPIVVSLHCFHFASKLLARFLLDRENPIREALPSNNLATARRLVNGGSNGLDRFTDAYNRGLQLIPEAAQSAAVGPGDGELRHSGPARLE